MITWVIYDISSDKDRGKIAKFCKEMGLIRVQYSVFLGDIPKNRIDEINLISKELIDLKTDAVFIIPVSHEDFKNKIILGKSFDEDFVSGKKQTFFL